MFPPGNWGPVLQVLAASILCTVPTCVTKKLPSLRGTGPGMGYERLYRKFRIFVVAHQEISPGKVVVKIPQNMKIWEIRGGSLLYWLRRSTYVIAVSDFSPRFSKSYHECRGASAAGAYTRRDEEAVNRASCFNFDAPCTGTLLPCNSWMRCSFVHSPSLFKFSLLPAALLLFPALYIIARFRNVAEFEYLCYIVTSSL